MEHLRTHPEDYTVVAWQQADLGALGVSPQQCHDALQWVEFPGRAHSAAQAVARLLSASRWWARPAGWALRAPGIRAVAAVTYRRVARQRRCGAGGCAVKPG